MSVSNKQTLFLFYHFHQSERKHIFQ